MFHSITLTDGSEYACEGARGSDSGCGLFVRRQDGTWQQLTGTGQTPVFKTPQALSRHVHRVLRDNMGERLPRMTSNDW